MIILAKVFYSNTNDKQLLNLKNLRNIFLLQSYCCFYVLFILCSTCSCVLRYWCPSVPTKTIYSSFILVFLFKVQKIINLHTLQTSSYGSVGEYKHLLFVQNFLNIYKISYSRDEIEKRIGEYEIVLSDLECRQVSYLTFFGPKRRHSKSYWLVCLIQAFALLCLDSETQYCQITCETLAEVLRKPSPARQVKQKCKIQGLSQEINHDF
jgi:hypothetical protein